MEDALSRHVLEKLSLEYGGLHKRQLFGCPAYFVGRSMFLCLHEGNVELKLPALEAEQARASADVGEFRPYGKKMQGWVGLGSEDDLQRYSHLFRQAAKYAQQRQAGSSPLS